MMVIVAHASLAGAEPAEVCPVLSPSLLVPFWQGESLWPACPVASPIASIAGRCLDGKPGCMKPCAFEELMRDKPLSKATFKYDDDGLLIASTVTSYYGGKPRDEVYKCTRDKAGHLTACTGTSTWKLAYRDGRLASHVVIEGGQTTLTMTYAYDKTGRLVTSPSKGTEGASRVTYTYNADGTLAQQLVLYAKSRIANKLTYSKGRLTGVDSKSNDKQAASSKTTYDYDASGRVIAEHEHDDRDVTYSYTYDSSGRLIKMVHEFDGTPYTATFTYSCR